MNKKILLKTILPIATVALLGGGIASSLILTSCSNKSEKALVIDVSTPTITSNGTTLNISGSYEAFNFDSPTIEFASGTSQWFGELSVNNNNKTFTTTLLSNNDIGDYDLQLVANNTIYSNNINFKVGPFATSDGSNWAGRISGTVQMTLNDDMTATIFRRNNYIAKNLVIPEYVLGNGKFYKVTSIGNGVFGGCSGLTGGLTIPNSVASVGEYAFYECSGLTGSLTIGSRVTSIGVSAFYGCSGLRGSLTIPNSVESIGGGAFQRCSGLTGSLTIPNNVASIGVSAFYGCSGLTGSLNIGSRVTSIGSIAFSGCNFNNIDIDGANPTYGLATNVGDAEIVVEKEIIGGKEVCLKDYNSRDIVGSLAIGQLIIPSGVTSIGPSAFGGCRGFTGSLTIPDSVISVGDDAFNGCSGFTNITLANRSAIPTWTGTNIFQEFSGGGTVSISGGSITADDVLIYLISKGLPDNWTTV